MKNFIIAISTFFLCHQVLHAQLSIHATQFRPTGEMGDIMEMKLSISIGYEQEFDEEWRVNFRLNYLKLVPRLDQFPVVGTISGGNGTFVSLGSQHFERFTMLMLDAAADRVIIDKDKLDIYAGFGICVGAASIQYDAVFPQIESTSYSGGGRLGGLLGRVGLDYYLTDELALQLLLDRRYFIITESGGYSANVGALGLAYYFN